MADNIPNAPGGTPVPPKPGEGPKPEVKKQTVRISLPPKPTATIKLPTLPGGAPAPAAPSAPAHAAPHPSPPSAARPAPPAPAPGASAARVAPPKSSAPSAAAAPPPGARPGAALAGGVKRISGLDLGLAIATAVVGLGAVGSLLLLLNLK